MAMAIDRSCGVRQLRDSQVALMGYSSAIALQQCKGKTYVESRIETLRHDLESVLQPSIRGERLLLKGYPKDCRQGQSEDDKRTS